MAQFGKMKKMTGVQEERGFTNPHVRFIRKRGRIIPIYNKKRIGQDVTNIGENIAVKGAVVAGVSALIKRTNAHKTIAKTASKFSFKSKMFNIKSGNSFKMKAFKVGSRVAGKSIKFGAKNSGKIGLAMLGLGIAGKMIGDELQMRSAFGKDFFFTKDRSGRDS